VQKINQLSHTGQKRKIYQRFAGIYDEIMGGRYVNLWWKAFRRMVRLHRITYCSVADLAGGTGEAAQRFYQENKSVIIVDQSADMLAQAQKRIPGIKCLQQDLRYLCLPEKVDLAVCVYGSIHYLKRQGELKWFFKKVRNALQDGGFFCFDYYTKYFLRTHYGSGSRIFRGRDYICCWSFRWDERRNCSKILIEGFTGQAETWHQQWTEEHIQYAYTLQELKDALRQAGFYQLRACELRKGTRPGLNDNFRIILAKAK